jgi:hypothetical protein
MQELELSVILLHAACSISCSLIAHVVDMLAGLAVWDAEALPRTYQGIKQPTTKTSNSKPMLNWCTGRDVGGRT